MLRLIINMGLLLCHWNEGQIILVNRCNVPQTQKSSSSSIQCRLTTLKFWKRWQPFVAKGHKCEGVVTGFFITTIFLSIQPLELVSFSQTLDHCSSLLPLFTWPYSLTFVTFSCSPNSKDPQKEEDLRQFLRKR